MTRLRYPAIFPDIPYPSYGRFVAVICSFSPDDAVHSAYRREKLVRQLEWWRRMTDIPVIVIASNWNDRVVDRCEELQRVAEHGGKVLRVPAQSLITNRIFALSELYDSGADWGIMMDDDALLYDSPFHNSGAAFFAEMATNRTEAYADVDVFFPINPQKRGFNPIWNKDPVLFHDNHVFTRDHDLKGSLFVVRNFPKFGRPAIFPPADFMLHGEDTLFAIEALANGCTIMRSDNIVLKEFSSISHFGTSRVAAMRAGAERMVEMYGDRGLQMNTHKGREHNLDRSKLIERSGREHSKRLVVRKPLPAIPRPF